MNRKDIKKQNIIQLIVLLTIILIVSYLSTFLFFRVDLTQEKRFTLSAESKIILKSLPDEVLIKVYLEGDMPLGFKKLNNSVREMLDEFRVYAGTNIEYQFIDPYANTDPKAVNDFIKDLYSKGLQPTNVKIKDQQGGQSQKIVVPGAILAYKGIELPINLLSNNPGLTGEENLNNSAQSLEYLLISNIRNITNSTVEKIAFIEGHGELDQYQTGDITKELANYYQVDRGEIKGNINSLKNYKAIIIAKPQTAFSEEDKFVLDQYIMNGGKVIWLIDAVNVSADSLTMGNTIAIIPQLNLDDQFFKYGIRINPSLVQDIQCSLIPVNTTIEAGQPKFAPAPWLYYPLLSGNAMNAISHNINMVKSEFCSYIDTLAANHKVAKTVLLQTSRFTKIKNVPAMISLAEIKEKQNANTFKRSNLAVAVLCTGQFESVFKNRVLSNLKIKGDFQFRDESLVTSQIFIADGDIIRNEIRNSPKGILISPLGLDRYTSQTFGNKELILNALNYLTDETGLMNLRTREIKLRLLDREMVREQKTFWILFNTLIPIGCILIAGIGIHFWRKKKYATK